MITPRERPADVIDVKLADAIDNKVEESDNESAADFMSQQPDDVYGIAMDEERAEMREFLQTDEKHGWKFDDNKIKKQQRSLSADKKKEADEKAE